MTFKTAITVAFALTAATMIAPATAQNAASSAQSGADFGSGSAANTPASSTSTSSADDNTAQKTQDEKPQTEKTPSSAASTDKVENDSPAKTPDTQAGKDAEKDTAESESKETQIPEKDTKAAATEATTSDEPPAAGKETDQPTTSIKANTDKQAERLTVASWGGAYTESQKRAYFTPFQDETGIAINTVLHKGKFEALSTLGESSSAKWDIVDIDPTTLERACKDGTLEKVSPSELEGAKDGSPASTDFLPGTLHECGIPSVAWSSAIVFDKRAFKKEKPESAKDFFDTKKFPGKRALPRDPKYVLELALMATGTEPEKVYAELSTDEGIDRAFEQLERIRDDIMWWEKAHQPIKQLAKKDAAMALAFNGRIFSAIVAANKPFDIVWDGQIFDLDFWAIPKGSPHKDKSLKFIAFATRPEAMAKQASWFPYGPVRKSAIAMVGKHPEVNVNMATYIPTAPANFKRALRLDTIWWKEHGEKIRKRYGAWIDAMIDPTSFEDEQR